MAKILEFPTKSVRDWRVIEEALRQVLERTPADQIAKDTIIGRMKPVYELCSRSFPVSIDLTLPRSTSAREQQAVVESVQGALQQFELDLQQLTNEILLERLTMEINRYYEAPDGDDPTPAG